MKCEDCLNWDFWDEWDIRVDQIFINESFPTNLIHPKNPSSDNPCIKLPPLQKPRK